MTDGQHNNDHAMLGRIDERVQALQASVLALTVTVSRLQDELDKYVLHARFKPVEMGFYSLVGIIVAAVVSAMVALVLR